ncbi:MAG TPA: DEAD/DEAH box helicase [Spirochaetia bacterium]|nr:DEAD/DEAH box helicase [Spirochaetia bacterium]
MHPASVPSQDDVLQLFRRAGFPSLTPLQQKLVPLLLKNRDAVAEVSEGGGTSAAVVAPLVLGLRGAGPALRALLLVPAAPDVGKLARAYARFTRVVRDAPSFVSLGETEDARREERRLEREAAIVAGTVERVIDHIRRGSISFAGLQTLVIREPPAESRADFVRDVQFIFAKCGERPRVVLLTRAPLAPDDELLQILHHPLSLGSQDREGPAPAFSHAVMLTEGRPAADVLARAALGLRLPPLVAFHAPRTDASALATALRSRGLRSDGLPPSSRVQGRRDMLLAFTRRELDVLLVPLAGASASDLEAVEPAQVVFLDLPTASYRSPGGVLKRASVLAFGERDRDLGKLQEAFGVAFDKKDIPDDDALLSGAIDRVLSRIKDEDKSELARLRARIRKQVPFLMRPLFMASLLKSQLPARSAASAPAARPASSRPRGAGAPVAPAAQVPPRGQRGRFGRSVEGVRGEPVRAESTRESARGAGDRAGPPASGDSTQLFVSIGRNRRVYARDLTELFSSRLQLAPGDIRDVRVFDKYSFVDIAPARAEEAIQQLNGVELKGRPLTVNYAKKKEENKAT